MNTDSTNPPGVIKLLGWLWAILGGMMILSGLMAFVVTTMMNSMAAGRFPPHVQNVPPLMAPFLFLFEYFRVLALVQIVLAGFIVFSALNFLQLREWARKALVVISALAASYVIGFTVFWMIMWVTITQTAATQMAATQAAGSGGTPMTTGIILVGVIGALLNMVLFSAPPILSFINLRRKDVRDAMQ